MGQNEEKGLILRMSKIFWSSYATYLFVFFASLGSPFFGIEAPALIGVALVIFIFAIYDTKKIGEFCRANQVEFPSKLWVFAVLTLFFTIITLPLYMHVRKNAIKQIFSSLEKKNG